MHPSEQDLIAGLQSGDSQRVSEAFAALSAHGDADPQVLLIALRSADAEVRAQAAEILSQTADLTHADDLANALGDSDGRVRSDAAAGLARLGDPRGIPALIATLDAYPDIEHGGFTRSMYALMRAGGAALPALAPLLHASDQATRWRVYTVIEYIIRHLPNQPVQWEQLHAELGGYDPAGPAPEREQSAERWAIWLRRHEQLF